MSQAIESISGLIHRQSITSPVSEVASVLQEILSRRLTAYIVGVADGKTISRWSSGEITDIRDAAIEKRLRTTYEITQLLMTNDSAQTAKAWFIGLNPQLDDVSPAEAIRNDQLKESLAAARAFTVGG
jgi:hypothetical protein